MTRRQLATAGLPIIFAALTLTFACTDEENIGGAEAKQLVGSGAVLLDVRSNPEFAAGHLPGAVHIPVGELEGSLSKLDKDIPIVVYCLSGGRSREAANLLKRQGFSAVHDLGSMSAYP